MSLLGVSLTAYLVVIIGCIFVDGNLNISRVIVLADGTQAFYSWVGIAVIMAVAPSLLAAKDGRWFKFMAFATGICSAAMSFWSISGTQNKDVYSSKVNDERIADIDRRIREWPEYQAEQMRLCKVMAAPSNANLERGIPTCDSSTRLAELKAEKESIISSKWQYYEEPSVSEHDAWQDTVLMTMFAIICQMIGSTLSASIAPDMRRIITNQQEEIKRKNLLRNKKTEQDIVPVPAKVPAKVPENGSRSRNSEPKPAKKPEPELLPEPKKPEPKALKSSEGVKKTNKNQNAPTSEQARILRKTYSAMMAEGWKVNGANLLERLRGEGNGIRKAVVHHWIKYEKPEVVQMAK